MRKINFYKIVFLVTYWISCGIYIVFYDASVLGFKSEIEAENYNLLRNLIAVVIVCGIGATFLGSLEVLYFSKIFRRALYKHPHLIELSSKDRQAVIEMFDGQVFSIAGQEKDADICW